jgi:nucleoside-diphosphate-sugar epimerase
MQRRRPDIGKVKALIGWEPRISLEQTLARVIDSLRPTSPAARGDAIEPR